MWVCLFNKCRVPGGSLHFVHCLESTATWLGFIRVLAGFYKALESAPPANRILIDVLCRQSLRSKGQWTWSSPEGTFWGKPLESLTIDHN